MTQPTPDSAITLELTADEASALSVALVLLIHDENSPTRWRSAASEIAARLHQARDAYERGT